jgi:hypothetical protein
MAWRLATALEVLRKEVNAAHPNRQKASDGTIGDVAHQSQGSASDHNPWLNNTVRAWDITTADFTDALAEWLRQKGQGGDPRLVGGGYVIYKARIASDNPVAGVWNWRPYSGDPHTSHIHVSVTRNAAYDSAAPWGVSQTQEEPDLTPEQGKQLGEIWQSVMTKHKIGPGTPPPAEVAVEWAAKNAWAAIQAVQLDIDKIKTGGVDLDALATKVADLIASRLKD